MTRANNPREAARQTRLATLLFVWAMCAPAVAATLRVPEDHTSIQAAMDLAESGDVVSVGPGIYNENVVFVEDDVVLKSREPRAATIEGLGTNHVVVFNLRRGTVEGFVITGSGDVPYAGVFTSQSSQVIRGNVITMNGGDGISISSGSLAHIEGNVITENGRWGSGLQCLTGASGTIVNNYIARNRYGINSSDCTDLVIVNNTIVDQTLWNTLLGDTTATITNNIIANADYGIYFSGPYDLDITGFVSGYLTLSYNLLWGHSEEDTWATLGGVPTSNEGPFDPVPGTGELRVAPGLVTDWELGAGSPCIDAGDNDAVPDRVATDIAGQHRLADDPATADTGNGVAPLVDIGCYEFGSEPRVCDAAAIEPIGPVVVRKAGAVSVELTWGPPASTLDGYTTWKTRDDKTSIPAAREGGPWPWVDGCHWATDPGCTDPDAVAGPAGRIAFYQVRGVCGTTEAPE